MDNSDCLLLINYDKDNVKVHKPSGFSSCSLNTITLKGIDKTADKDVKELEEKQQIDLRYLWW